jgi:hypothetical protein
MLDATFVSDEECYHLSGHVNSQNSRILSTEVVPMQPVELLFTLSRLECDVQCLTVGFLGPFSPKTPLTRSASLT